MRIISLEITNFKTLSHLSWTDIPATGVFVIHGDNEQGKSTILEALHHVLFIKHNSKAQPVRASQPIGKDVAPEVSLRFAFNQTECLLHKRWLKGAQAEFHMGSTQSYTGAQAEEKFAEYFAQHVDVSLFEVLFTKQGELTTTLGISEITPLRAALDSNSGDTTDNQVGESTEIMARVLAEYSKYYSPKTQRPTKLLTQMQANLTAAKETHKEKTAKLATLEDHINQIERIQRGLAQDKKQLPEAKQAAELRSKELAMAEAVEHKAQTIAHDLELAEQTAKLKNHQLQQREQLATRLQQAHERLAELKPQVAQLTEQAEVEQQQITALQQTHAAALAAEEAARENLRLATELVAHAVATTKRQELARTYKSVIELDQQLRELSEVTEVTEDTILALQKAEQEVLMAKHTHNQKSTKLIITATTDTDIEIDGQTITANTTSQEHDITATTSVVIGAVTARLEPGAGASESAAMLAAAEKHLKQLVDQTGFSSAIKARRAREDYLAAHQQHKLLVSQRAAALQDTTLAQIEAELKEDFTPAAVDAETARKQQEEAEAQFDQRQKDRACAGEELNTMQQRLAQRDLLAKQAVLQEAKEAAAEIQRQQDSAEQQLPLDDLQQEVAAAQAVVAQTHKRRQAVDKELAVVDVESKRQLAQAAQSQLEAIKHRIATADVDIAAQQSYIDAYAGVAEECDQAEAQLKIIQRKAEELDLRASAAKLLYQVMLEKQQEAHEKYSQPLVAELARLSRPIFGSQVGYTLSDSLEVTQRIGRAGETFDVAALSGGAQEQLAILIRFAIASLVGDEAQAVPVFLDDALGSSDPARLVAMGAVFNEIGKQRQVFVLTCVPNRYESVTDRVDIPIRKMLSPSRL